MPEDLTTTTPYMWRFYTLPRNSDEEPDWDDDDFPDLTEILERLEISETLTLEDDNNEDE